MFVKNTKKNVKAQEKKEDIWPRSMPKAPTPIEKSKKQIGNIKNATKTLISQQLRTELGRSVGEKQQLPNWCG